MSVRPNVRSLLGVLIVMLLAFVVGGGGGKAPTPSVGLGARAVDACVKSAGVTDNWLINVKTRIEREEYNASVDERGLQAPNRAHNLRTYFLDGRIEVVPRGGETGDAWSFSWRTTAWGRKGNMVDVAGVSAEPVVTGSRVSYVRGDLDEWYDNKKEGLEQGFMVSSRPAAEGPLRIEGKVGGGLRAEFRPDEGAIDFFDGRGARVLRYAELRVRDASNREIPSHLRIEGDQVTIAVDDASAEYPLTIDPLMTTPAWSAASGQTEAFLGWSVGTAGDVNGDGFSDVIVGAYMYDGGELDEGRAYVYVGTAAGLSSEPYWIVEGDQASAWYGHSVSTAGDVNNDGYSDVIVGALFFTNGELYEGRAYVYHGSADSLPRNADWTAEGNQASAAFGYSVGTAGDVNGDGYSDVIVGAYTYDNGQSDEGRVFVYHGSSGGLTAIADWTAESNQASARFGNSVATAGDVNGDGYSDVIVGAYWYDNGQLNEGRAFVYHGSASGLAGAAAWTAESDLAGANFGHSAATAGDVNGDGYSDVIVGAHAYTNGETYEGRAFVYHGSAVGLAAMAAWTAESNQGAARFGYSVGTAGDVNGDGFSDVIVGAPYYDNGPGAEGRAYVYSGSAAGLGLTPHWTTEIDQVGASFGWSVGTAGDVNGDGYSDVIVGAPTFDATLFDEGGAFVYHGGAAGVASSAGWTAESNQAGADMGWSVATAGDVNGDGYSDVVVGANWYDNGQLDEGRAFVYHGSASGLAGAAAWAVESNQASAEFGRSVGTAGDVNGDGCSDVIVGAPYYDNGEADEGRAFVYHGSPGGLAVSAAWTVESNQASAEFGRSVGTAGDVNGDGCSDVIVGAPYYDNGEADEGCAFVYHGSPGGLAVSTAWTAESNQPAGTFGWSVGTAGDVNGDGYSDVIVGAYAFDATLVDEGRAFVYHGSAGGLAGAAAWTAEGSQQSAAFGWSVGTAGDVNGDGYSDAIVGGAYYDNGQLDEGRAFVYHGSASGLAAGAAWTAESNQGGALIGISVGTAGDVNGDGYSDVIVAAPYYHNGEADEGRAFVHHGAAAGLAAMAAWTAESNQPWAEFGHCVGTAGDVNGDGYSDVIVGGPYYDNGQLDEGSVFVYYGNDGDGLHRVASQFVPSGARPVALLGLSGSNDSFLLKAVGRTPAGRGNVRLQCEVKPLGTPFDGGGLITGSAQNTGVPGAGGSVVNLSRLVSGLTVSTLYHWRLRTLSDSPFFPRSPWFSTPYNCVTEADLRTGAIIGVESKETAPPVLLLSRGVPNPFDRLVHLAYVLPERGRARIVVFDVSGRQTALLLDTVEEAGQHEVDWDGRGATGAQLPAGVYFVQLDFQGHKETRKVVLTR